MKQQNLQIQRGMVIVTILLFIFVGILQAQLNPVPVLSTISPESIERGNDGITISLFGENFVSASVVSWNGVELSTNIVSSSELEANVPSEYFSQLGTVDVNVINPLPGGGTSENKHFTVTGVDQIVNSVSPAIMRQDVSDLSIIVRGENFTENSVVRFAGVERTTTFVSATELHAIFLISDLENVGHYNITVYNFGSGGVSNAVDFQIIYGTPEISDMTPDLRKVRDAGFIISISGVRFAPSATVFFDDIPLLTTFVSSAQIRAEIPDALIDVPKTYLVSVKNPAPGGGSSNTVTFVVVDPVPVINSVSPGRQRTGSAGFMMKVNGTGFSPTSKGLLNGSERITTFVNESQIYVSIGSEDLRVTGTYPVTVRDLSLSKKESVPAYLAVSENKGKSDPTNDKIVNDFSGGKGLVPHNYPNPFNPVTEIRFAIPSNAVISLEVYNSVGQEIGILLNKVELSAGEHSVPFDGAGLSSGQYFYRLTSDNMAGNVMTSMNKMILIK
jgi:hypothetical protein